MNGWMEGWIDRQTNRQTERQGDRETGRWRDRRWIDGQIDEGRMEERVDRQIEI